MENGNGALFATNFCIKSKMQIRGLFNSIDFCNLLGCQLDVTKQMNNPTYKQENMKMKMIENRTRRRKGKIQIFLSISSLWNVDRNHFRHQKKKKNETEWRKKMFIDHPFHSLTLMSNIRLRFSGSYHANRISLRLEKYTNSPQSLAANDNVMTGKMTKQNFHLSINRQNTKVRLARWKTKQQKNQRTKPNVIDNGVYDEQVEWLCQRNKIDKHEVW